MRKLNGFYAIEVINGRLNGSSDQVENSRSSFKNATYTKKIAGKSKISTQCQKFNMREYMAFKLGIEQSTRIKEGKQIKILPDPYNSIIDDIFGFMIAKSQQITKEEYEALEENQKKLFTKSNNIYKTNITKKRRARLQMNALVNISNSKVNWEWNVASSETDSMPYQQEVYSGIHTSIFNLNIEEVGKFIVSDIPSEFRDYSEEEGKVKEVKDLSRDEKYNRICNTLDSIEYLAISSNQTNHLTDTKPKFIILADYKWGNNAFQGIIKDYGIDINMLKECIDQNEEYRCSNVYIGINKFYDSKYDTAKENLEKELEEYDFIKISNVHEAFKGYKEELDKNI